MPFAETGPDRTGPVKLYYESRGRGPAVLLVMGLGDDVERVVADGPRPGALVPGARLRQPRHRRSDSSGLPYSVAQMADDAITVLDAAGEQRAHVYGISLGGMVAQELALRHPDRVRALVLGATTPGGSRAVLAGVPAVGFVSRAAAMAPEEALWAAVRYTYAETTRRRHAERIAEDIAHRVRFPPDPSAYRHQVAAAANHSTFGRLGEIAAPTLIVHGEEDATVPPQSGGKSRQPWASIRGSSSSRRSAASRRSPGSSEWASAGRARPEMSERLLKQSLRLRRLRPGRRRGQP